MAAEPQPWAHPGVCAWRGPLASAVQRHRLRGQTCSIPALSQTAATGHALLSAWNMASTVEKQNISFHSI